MKQMANKEKMQISDELLKLALGQYLENQGRKLSKEADRLSEKNIAQPTEKQVKAFRKLCKREFRKKNRKVSVLYKVAAVAAAILIIFNISIISVPAVKRVVLNFLTKSEKTHTTVYIDDKERNIVEDGTNYRIITEEEYGITYLPEGFYIEKEEKTSRTMIRSYENTNDADQMIMFTQSEDSATVNIDTEDATVDYVDINGNNALLSQKDNVITITWRTDKHYLSITSLNVESSEVLKIARSVKKEE